MMRYYLVALVIVLLAMLADFQIQGFCEDIHALRLSGLQLASEGKFQEAKKAFEEAGKTDPSDNVARGSLLTIQDIDSGAITRECGESFFQGLMQLQEGNVTAAQTSLNNSLSINPNYYRAYNVLGVMAAASGEHAQSEEYLKKAVSLKPNYAEAYFNLASVYQSENNSTAALENFKRAAELDPSSIESCRSLAFAYASVEQFPQAITYFEKALKMGDSGPDIYFNLGLAYLMTGDYAKSKGKLLKALSMYEEAGNSAGAEKTQGYLDKFKEIEKRALSGTRVSNKQ